MIWPSQFFCQKCGMPFHVRGAAYPSVNDSAATKISHQRGTKQGSARRELALKLQHFCCYGDPSALASFPLVFWEEEIQGFVTRPHPPNSSHSGALWGWRMGKKGLEMFGSESLPLDCHSPKASVRWPCPHWMLFGVLVTGRWNICLHFKDMSLPTVLSDWFTKEIMANS